MIVTRKSVDCEMQPQSFSLSDRDFSWSPGDNIIAFWVPEDKDIPARVTLMQFPSRLEIRVRNLFNVVDCKLHWQRQGDYLCVKVDRTPRGTQVGVFVCRKSFITYLYTSLICFLLFNRVSSQTLRFSA